MPQDFDGDPTLANGSMLGLRKAAGTPEEGLRMSKGDVPLRGRLHKTRSVEFRRAGPPVCVARAGAGAATGTEGDVNLCMVQGLTLEYAVIGTQTILGPSLTSAGLDISQDLTNNDGVQYSPSLLTRNPDYVYTIGTSPAFYVRAKIKITDVSGSDALFVGFVKAAAYAAASDDYTDAALIGNVSGDIKLNTILNNADTTVTDTTNNWVDGETHELTVRVDADGVVTYLIDNANPLATAAFTFDDGDEVVPLVYLRHDSDVAESTILVEFDSDFER